jgi:hypothetical protein
MSFGRAASSYLVGMRSFGQVEEEAHLALVEEGGLCGRGEEGSSRYSVGNLCRLAEVAKHSLLMFHLANYSAAL